MSNSLVEPKNVVLSLVTDTKKPIHVKQHTLVGSLSPVLNVEQLQSKDSNVGSSKPNDQIPEHLQKSLNGASEKLTDEHRESLRYLLVEFQNVFIGPGRKLGRTDHLKHTIDTGQTKAIKIVPRRGTSGAKPDH